jgi:hypothetical protein
MLRLDTGTVSSRSAPRADPARRMRMSGLISGLVWNLDLPQQEKYVLLAYADHANHQGGDIRPAVALIAWKTGYTARNVQKIVSTLRRKKILIPLKYHNGGRGRVTEYRIAFPRALMRQTPEKGEPEDTLFSEKDEPEDTLSDKRVNWGSQKGELEFTPNVMKRHKEDLENPPISSQREDPLALLHKTIATIPPELATMSGAFHAACGQALRALGWTLQAEYPVPDRGDGHQGRVDFLVTHPVLMGIEIDRTTPRDKSVQKLQAIDGLKVIVLRDAILDTFPPITGIDAVVCYGGASAPVGRTPSSPRKTPMPEEPEAQAALKAQILDADFYAWAAKHGVTDLIAPQWEAFVCKALAKGYRYVSWRHAFMCWLTSDYQQPRRVALVANGILDNPRTAKTVSALQDWAARKVASNKEVHHDA